MLDVSVVGVSRGGVWLGVGPCSSSGEEALLFPAFWRALSRASLCDCVIRLILTFFRPDVSLSMSSEAAFDVELAALAGVALWLDLDPGLGAAAFLTLRGALGVAGSLRGVAARVFFMGSLPALCVRALMAEVGRGT